MDFFILKNGKETIMPYIAIKAYPKDDATKREIVDRINQLFLEVWKCPQEAISISIEEFEPALWEENVFKKEIEPHRDKMMMLSGKKTY
ncbi:MAG: tautomerase family protein [Deltaproteobacteria bacterium]|nr:tautomerase family protein [Deltaproteobacteria bacterium]